MPELIKMSHNACENLYKKEEIRNGKMNRVKSSLENRGNKNRSIKKGRESISSLERKERMFKSRSRQFDQLVKL